MYYLWFVPLFAALVVFTWVLYLVVARGLPKTSDRSVEDALAQEREEDEKARADSGIGSVAGRAKQDKWCS
jgi:hypothetical protein